MKFGICNEIFQDWKIEDAMAFAKKAGYDGIEIAPFTMAKYVTEISPRSAVAFAILPHASGLKSPASIGCSCRRKGCI